MDAVLLARIQFAVTIGFHYLYPPISIGLGLVLVAVMWLYARRRTEFYEKVAKFWTGIFGLTFAIGVATGIVMEFEFGTNWAAYSRFVGDVFGSPLAAEGVFAFFLESTFLGLLLFGWKKISPRFHFFSALMVAAGAHLSALWIIVANSWMQTPAGYEIVTEGLRTRAEITDFWAMVFNPSSLARFTHTIIAAWQTGACLAMCISAIYLLKKRHTEFAKLSLKISLVVALVASLCSLFTGHWSAMVVTRHQPAKLAAMEGLFETSGPAPVHVFGWVDEEARKVKYGLRIPGGLSLMAHMDYHKPVTGLNDIPQDEWPPVNPTFQSFHLMVAIGMALIGLNLLAAFFWWRGWLFKSRWLLFLLALSALGPQICNQAGWFTAEVGRQPWIVWHLMRTADGVSECVNASQILFSLILFTLVYLFMFVLFLFVLARKVKEGPGDGT